MKFITDGRRRWSCGLGLLLLGLGTSCLHVQQDKPVRVEPVQEPPPLYLDINQPVGKRVEDLLGRMTLEEKIAQVHAD